MNQFITRAYNQIVLNKKQQTITKSSKEKRLDGEIEYYKHLEKELVLYFPRIISAKRQKNVYKLELEYFPFENLGTVFLNPNISDNLVRNIVSQLSHILSCFSKIEFGWNPDSMFERARHKMYIDKTEKEYQNLVTNFPFFTEISKKETVVINHIEYLNFITVWPKIKEFIKTNYCNNGKLTGMHGDLCWSNILCGIDSKENIVIKLVDPRGNFGETYGNGGDFFYDLAKLSHSLNGRYEDIINDRFELVEDVRVIKFNFKKPINPIIKKEFNKKIFDKFDKLKIKIIEATVWIGMCARHYDSLPRQKVMYATGIKMLNEIHDEITK